MRRPRSGPVVRGRTRRPHDEIARLVQEMISERIERVMPRMGTVVGSDTDGSPRVRLDDEARDREVGFPATRGQKYRDGKRVLLVPTGEDRYVMAGGVEFDGNTKIDNEDIADGSVRGSHVDTGAVANGKPVERGNLIVTEGNLATSMSEAASKPATVGAVSDGLRTRMTPPSGSGDTDLAAYVGGAVNDRGSDGEAKLATVKTTNALRAAIEKVSNALIKTTRETVAYSGRADDADIVKELRKVRGKGVLRVRCDDGVTDPSRCWVEGG